MKVLTLALACSAALLAGNANAASYVVQARALNFDNALATKVQAAGGRITARYPQIGVALVEADSQFASRASQLPELQSVTADRTLQYDIPEAVTLGNVESVASPPNTGDNDFLYDLQWGFDAINVPEAWAQGYRGAGATVAVLDSGLDCTHPDLAVNNLAALNASFIAGETACQVPAFPAFNHGTHVAGTIAAPDNGMGVIGVAPQAKFFAVKVLSAYTGSGSFGAMLQGIVYATDNGADIINMSLGVRGGLPDIKDTRELIAAVQRAVLYARKNKTVVIAAAGNDGINFDGATDADGNKIIAFPAGVGDVVAISATAPVGWAVNPAAANLDLPASYTNTGKHLIDIAAPGGDTEYPGSQNCTVAGRTRPCWVFDLVISTTTGGWAWAGGTSMASPHAAGVAALVVGPLGGQANPGRGEEPLLGGGDDLGSPGLDAIYGRGRLNAVESLP